MKTENLKVELGKLILKFNLTDETKAELLLKLIKNNQRTYKLKNETK